jgi:hypothetical protein
MVIMVPTLATGISALAGSQVLLAAKTRIVTALTGLQTAAQWALNTAVAANPVVLIAIAIVAAVAGVVAAFLIFRDKIPAVFDFVGKAVENFVNFYISRMNKVIDVIDAITPGTIKRIDEISVSWKGAGEAVERFADGTVEKLSAIKDAITGVNSGIDLIGDKATGLRKVEDDLVVMAEAFEDVGRSVNDASTEAADAIEQEWIPSVEGLRFSIGQLVDETEEAFLQIASIPAQEALVLDKLASIALNEELGPLRDAMNLLAEEGMGNVIQAFADGTMTKQEFLETALLVREAIDDENKALKEQEGLLKRLKEATAVRFAPIMKTREEELAGMIGGAPLTREERVRAHAAGLLSTRNPGLIVSGAATLMGSQHRPERTQYNDASHGRHHWHRRPGRPHPTGLDRHSPSGRLRRSDTGELRA